MKNFIDDDSDIDSNNSNSNSQTMIKPPIQSFKQLEISPTVIKPNANKPTTKLSLPTLPLAAFNRKLTPPDHQKSGEKIKKNKIKEGINTKLDINRAYSNKNLFNYNLKELKETLINGNKFSSKEINTDVKDLCINIIPPEEEIEGETHAYQKRLSSNKSNKLLRIFEDISEGGTSLNKQKLGIKKEGNSNEDSIDNFLLTVRDQKIYLKDNLKKLPFGKINDDILNNYLGFYNTSELNHSDMHDEINSEYIKGLSKTPIKSKSSSNRLNLPHYLLEDSNSNSQREKPARIERTNSSTCKSLNEKNQNLSQQIKENINNNYLNMSFNSENKQKQIPKVETDNEESIVINQDQDQNEFIQIGSSPSQTQISPDLNYYNNSNSQYTNYQNYYNLNNMGSQQNHQKSINYNIIPSYNYNNNMYQSMMQNVQVPGMSNLQGIGVSGLTNMQAMQGIQGVNNIHGNKNLGMQGINNLSNMSNLSNLNNYNINANCFNYPNYSSKSIDSINTNNNFFHSSESFNLIKIIKDQSQLKILYSLIEKNDPILNEVINQLVENFVSICSDSSGNYFVQKLIVLENKSLLDIIIAQVVKKFDVLALNNFGTRVVQKLIERLDSFEVNVLKQCIEKNLADLSINNNGIHLLTKYSSNSNDCDFIYTYVEENIIILAKNKEGCCMIQKLLEIEKNFKEKMIKSIIDNTLELIVDKFANYVIQFIIQLENVDYNRVLFNLICDSKHFILVCKEKFSYNVVEKCLDWNNKTVHSYIINAILTNKNNIEELLTDTYGNYVIQKALDKANPDQIEILFKGVADCIHKLNNFTFGPKLIIKLYTKFPKLKDFEKENSSNDSLNKKLKGKGNNSSISSNMNLIGSGNILYGKNKNNVKKKGGFTPNSGVAYPSTINNLYQMHIPQITNQIPSSNYTNYIPNLNNNIVINNNITNRINFPNEGLLSNVNYQNNMIYHGNQNISQGLPQNQNLDQVYQTIQGVQGGQLNNYNMLYNNYYNYYNPSNFSNIGLSNINNINNIGNINKINNLNNLNNLNYPNNYFQQSQVPQSQYEGLMYNNYNTHHE